jgi:hypothetical protein
MDKGGAPEIKLMGKILSNLNFTFSGTQKLKASSKDPCARIRFFKFLYRMLFPLMGLKAKQGHFFPSPGKLELN